MIVVPAVIEDHPCMNKAPSKLPVNRRKPIGRSISESEVAKMVRSAESRREIDRPDTQKKQPKPKPERQE
jgi:hypothetical protein